MLKIYEGGSHKDPELWSNDPMLYAWISDLSTPIHSIGNQIFIEFKSDGYGSEKGFSASFLFGIRTS